VLLTVVTPPNNRTAIWD